VELDVLRGAAALAVIILHASTGPVTEQAAVGRASWVLLIANVATRFAVPVFMILSGMGLTLSTHRDESYPRFMRRRLSSIMPEYIAWTLIYVWLLPSDGPMSLRTVLADLLTGHASRHLYFVPAVVRLYLLYPVLRYFARSTWSVAACCALSWSMIWLSPLLVRTWLGALLDDVLPLCWFGYFVLGIWLGQARSAHADANFALTRIRSAAALVAIALLGAMLALVRSVVAQSADIEVALGAAEPLVFPYSVGILLWCSAASIGTGRVVRFLTFVSDHSYAVYLSHNLMLHLCELTLEALAIERTHLTRFAIGVALGIPLSLATAVLSDRAKRGLRREPRLSE
jgi:surface polysaccharide O-acyltransferase-like enzyme